MYLMLSDKAKNQRYQMQIRMAYKKRMQRTQYTMGLRDGTKYHFERDSPEERWQCPFECGSGFRDVSALRGHLEYKCKVRQHQKCTANRASPAKDKSQKATRRILSRKPEDRRSPSFDPGHDSEDDLGPRQYLGRACKVRNGQPGYTNPPRRILSLSPPPIESDVSMSQSTRSTTMPSFVFPKVDSRVNQTAEHVITQREVPSKTPKLLADIRSVLDWFNDKYSLEIGSDGSR
jgi:hypothetical protein